MSDTSSGSAGELKSKVTPTPLSTSKLKTASNINPKPKSKGKVFQCTNFPPCSMSFTRYEHLARHIRKHTGERPFQCDFCNKKFSRLDNLRQHRHTVHSKEVTSSQSKDAATAKEQKLANKGQMERQTLEYPVNGIIDQQKLQNLRYQQDQAVSPSTNAQPQVQQQYYGNYPPQLPVGMNAMQIPMIMNNQMPLHHLPNVQRMYPSLSPVNNIQMFPLNSNNELQVPYFNSQQQKPASQPPSAYQSASNLPPPRKNTLLERSSANREFRPKANKPIPLNINEEISSANALLSGTGHSSAAGEVEQRDPNNTYLSNLVTPTTATTNGSISSAANLSSATNMTSFNGSQYSSHLQSQYPMNYSNPQGYQSPYHSSYNKLLSSTTSPSFSNLNSPYTLNFNSYPNSASTNNNSSVSLLNENSKNMYQLQYGYSTNVLKTESDTLSPTTTSYPVDSLKLPSLPQFRNIPSQSLNKPSPLGLSFQQNASDNAATNGSVEESEKFANDSNDTIKPLPQSQEIVVEASSSASS